MSMIYGAIIGGGLGIASAVSSNAAISKTANANAKATAANLLQNFNVTQTQLQDKANEVNNSTGMQLTDLLFQSLAAKGTTVAAQSERGIVGATAARQASMVDMKEALTADRVIQKGEAALLDVQNEMKNSKYSYESGMLSNTVNFNNTMSQTTGVLGVLAAGQQGSMAGASVSKTFFG